MSKALKAKLAELREAQGRFSPDPLWVEKNKQEMMARIESSTASAPAPKPWQIFLPTRMIFAARPVATLVIVSIVSVVGWTASVSASYQSLPGDLLYNVKLASERTKIEIAGIVQGSEKKAKLLNDAAKTRAYEAKALIAQKKDAKLVERTLQDLEETVEEAKATTKTVTEKTPSSASKAVAELAQSNELITDTLGEVFDGTDLIESDIAEKIVKTSQAVTAKSVEAVKDIVEKQEGGTLLGSNVDDVKNVVGNVIESVNKSIKETSEALVKITETKGVVSVSVSVSTTDGLGDLATSTTSTTPADTTNKTEEQLGEESTNTIDVATLNLVEARQLLDQGKLREALEKVSSVTAPVTTPVITDATQNPEQTTTGDTVTKVEEKPSSTSVAEPTSTPPQE